MTVNINPITRGEHYLSAIAGESELPESIAPITRDEIYYEAILNRITGIGTPSYEDISRAVTEYLDEHGIAEDLFIASADIQEVLQG